VWLIGYMGVWVYGSMVLLWENVRICTVDEFIIWYETWLIYSFFLYNSPPQARSLVVACSGVMSR
jgi:hypothetical protein